MTDMKRNLAEEKRPMDDEVEIDLGKLLRALLKKLWLIILCAAIVGGGVFAYTRFAVTPLYEAKALMYVNNTNISLGDTKVSLSASDISASQSLVDTYIVIMNSRPVLEQVIRDTGVNYTVTELEKMISASAVNGTEIFQIVVTDADPVEGAKIANALATMLPDQIASIIDGCSARIVETAIPAAIKASPNTGKNTVIGALAGVLLACAYVTIRFLTDDIIDSEEDLAELSDLPVLAAIPELTAARNAAGYYGGYGAGKKKGGKA